VAVEDHHHFEALALDLVSEVADDPHQRFRLETDRTAESAVFMTRAHRHRRQQRGAEVLGDHAAEVIGKTDIGVERQMVAAGRENATYRHLITAEGYGPILSSAMAAMVVDPGAFRRACDFAAALGLVPRQDGTGGKVRLGPISKRGNGYLRRLLVNGAASLIISGRAKRDPWLAKLLATKPRKVAIVALANKLARIGWALMVRQQDYRFTPAAA